MADAFANLAATLALEATEDMTIPVCSRWVVTPPEEESALQSLFMKYKKKTGASH